MSYENDIIAGLAALLAKAGVGEWNPSGVYPKSGTRPAIYQQVYPDTPRPIIVMTPYPVEGALAPNDSILGVQVRTRTPGRDPRATVDLDAAVYDVLHGIHGVPVGGHRVTKILFQSGASMGQDASERWGRSANYYITGPRHRGEA